VAKPSTPLMQQYLRIKSEHPDEILLFRLGDFFETFFEDARLTAKALDIVLTSRNAGDGEAAIPLAGFPAHAAEGYIGRLLRAGHRVAVCEQMEDPKKAKGLVKREVIEVLSTGTALAEGFLDGSRNNWLMAAAPGPEGEWGLAVADVSTGDFLLTEVSGEQLLDEVQRWEPSEVLLPQELEEARLAPFTPGERSLTRLEGFRFDPAAGEQALKEHFGVTTLKGFGLEGASPGVGAAAALIGYLRSQRLASLGHLKRLRVLDRGAGMLLDAATVRNLELVANLRDGGKSGTLLGVLDRTCTGLGARALRRALLQPLTRLEEIEERLDAVTALVETAERRERIRTTLEGLGDLERLAVRVETGKASPRDLAALRAVQGRIPGLRSALEGLPGTHLERLHHRLDPLAGLTGELQAALVDEPPLLRTEGGIFRGGWSAELDHLRELASSGKGWIAELQRKERERTGIPTLKVGYNKVFGYYLEVTRTHADKVPQDYQRKQTLVAAERYITPELKEKEEEVLGAQENAWALESELFEQLRARTAAHLEALQANAAALGMLDVLAGLAEAAVRSDWVRPGFDPDGTLLIEAGRHPVVEPLLPAGTFIPNDLELGQQRRIAIITGPNMAGKSTYLRQVGLISLMAQAGSFVPAARARLPVLDRIFTRVGAMDNLAGGESTFLVEMHETANILHHATGRSLVLLDEVGRGTSTYDGLSIAWAVAEHLHEQVGAFTLFATHYHELTVLADRLPRVFNLNVAVKEWGDRVIFLHKIVPGGCDHSYGIHVAELAGVPRPVIDRARVLLRNLEADRPLPQASPEGKPIAAQSQMDLFPSRPDPLIQELRRLDPETLTPLEALNLLARLRELL
jgi:DNA mismatch repair protein MutS